MLNIVLDAPAYDALMRVAGTSLVAYVALVRAETIVGLTTTSPSIFVVRCDDIEARSPLTVAERDCPAAAPDIRLAVQAPRAATS